MNSTHHIFHQSDLYEILVSGTLVTRIYKFCGESQLRRVVTFEALPKEVVEELLDQLLNRE